MRLRKKSLNRIPPSAKLALFTKQVAIFLEAALYTQPYTHLQDTINELLKENILLHGLPFNKEYILNYKKEMYTYHTPNLGNRSFIPQEYMVLHPDLKERFDAAISFMKQYSNERAEFTLGLSKLCTQIKTQVELIHSLPTCLHRYFPPDWLKELNQNLLADRVIVEDFEILCQNRAAKNLLLGF